MAETKYAVTMTEGTHRRHKDGTNMPSQRRNSITITKMGAKIPMSHRLQYLARFHQVITCHSTWVEHKELTYYMNSKHNSFPSNFTKPLNIQRYSQPFQSLQTHFLSKDFVSTLPIIKASLNFANNAINP